MNLSASLLQDYMQNVHGKEIDLLRTTVKVPGKRLPRATTAAAPSASPKANGLAKERSSTQLTGGTGKSWCGCRAGASPCHWQRLAGLSQQQKQFWRFVLSPLSECLGGVLALLCRVQVGCPWGCVG